MKVAFNHKRTFFLLSLFVIAFSVAWTNADLKSNETRYSGKYAKTSCESSSCRRHKAFKQQRPHIAANSIWVHTGPDGKLVYKSTDRGDKIMDFSSAGFMGGGIAFPDPPVVITLAPVAGDNSMLIQQAIDQVSSMKMINGYRGTILLKPGVYDCSQTLKIEASGVVLRGSGSRPTGTIINMTGGPHNGISIKGNVRSQTVSDPVAITDHYVPSGTSAFSVSSAAGFKAGDSIRIVKPVTESWIRFMGMDHLVRDGKNQTWISGDIPVERTIKSISGNKIMVDIPLTDNYDATYLDPAGTQVVKVASVGEISRIGIEELRIVAPAQSLTINESHHRAFSISGSSDCWAKNIEIFNTVNSVSVTGRRITIDHVNITHEKPTIGAAKPADLNGSGPQILFNQCNISGDNLFFFATGAKVSGPVVLLNCTFNGNGWVQPHQRWATGVLIDNCHVPNGGIDFMNRGEMGSGHGWAIGWSVAWNCTARSFLNQQPPGAANWVIGSVGEKQRKAMPFDSVPLLPEGIYDAHGTYVRPGSLYLAQLAERLGTSAVKNIGYE
ncbi:MAG TPA: hypothetical protein VNR87_06805 [Flavisolibacter sp.]|nr:hypothetical protein [Flavisolibacter sp.]